MSEVSRASYVATGSRWPARLVLEQAETLLELMSRPEESAALAPLGVTPERLASLREDVQTLTERLARQSQAKSTIPQSSAKVAALQVQVKAWSRHLAMAAKNAYEDSAPEMLADLLPSSPMGRSVPRMVAYLVTVLPNLTKHASALAQWGFGSEQRAEGESLLQQLRAADAEQEVAVKSLPAETASLYEINGRLVTQLKKLVRLGRVAHEAYPERARAYDLKLLKREYTKGRGAEVAAPVAAPA